jgi:hypothetical protein
MKTNVFAVNWSSIIFQKENILFDKVKNMVVKVWISFCHFDHQYYWFWFIFDLDNEFYKQH